jgi:hypothetical protein
MTILPGDLSLPFQTFRGRFRVYLYYYDCCDDCCDDWNEEERDLHDYNYSDEDAHYDVYEVRDVRNGILLE